METVSSSGGCSDKGCRGNSNQATSDNRRNFVVGAMAIGAGVIAGVVPALAAVVAGLNPLRQKSQVGGFRRLASLDALPEDGTPRRFPVIADRTDAWNRIPNQPIGAVLLRRVENDRVEALNVICPHLGCTVGYVQGEDGGKLFCPCHVASFDLSGKRLDETSPSPRDLDVLEVDAEKLKLGQVWVKFQNFQTGTAKKVAEA